MIAQNIHSGKWVVIVLFMFALIGCGGGGERSVGNNTTGGGGSPAPDNTPAPAPAPGGGNTPSPGTGTASLSWTPPTTYEDGSVMANLAGHNIYMDSGNGYVKIGTLTNPSISDYLVENLASGSYSFVVTAFDSQGIESTFSVGASLTI